MNLSEWVREAMLDRLKPRDALNNETVMAELMALRTIVINLAIVRRRQPMSQDKIQELIDYPTGSDSAAPRSESATRRSRTCSPKESRDRFSWFRSVKSSRQDR